MDKYQEELTAWVCEVSTLIDKAWMCRGEKRDKYILSERRIPVV